MFKDLSKYLRDIKKINLRKLEKTVTAKVKDASKKTKTYKIHIRENPAFFSKARIDIKRELRPIEIKKIRKSTPQRKCVFCNPFGFAGFDPKTKLDPSYHLNDSTIISNLFPAGKIHGIILHTKKHIVDARNIKIRHWVDSIKLVQKAGNLSGKKYVSYNVNHGSKAGASIEHFHGQFHCEDEPISKTLLSMKLTKKFSGKSQKYWKGWVKSMLSEGLVLDYDPISKVVMFVEWSPVFGKTEIVVMTMETSAFQEMSQGEVEVVAKYLKKATEITTANISEQYNIINFSAAPNDDYCNQFRIFSRAPSSQGIKSWEGYMEFMGETIPHTDPKKFAILARKVK
jgi:galactose-1-phosphate uridylyltransferase